MFKLHIPAFWGVTLGLLLGVPVSALHAQAVGAAPFRSSGTMPVVFPTAKVETPPDYVLGPDDVIDVEVWNEPNISGKVPIRPDGRIELPLIGELQAAGLTPQQLQAQIVSRLRSSIGNPQVAIVVEETNSRHVNVLGQVIHPGSYSLVTHMTVLDAIAVAGGPGRFAHLNKIYLLRTIQGEQYKYRFDYKSVIAGKDADENMELQPGDAVIVP